MKFTLEAWFHRTPRAIIVAHLQELLTQGQITTSRDLSRHSTTSGQLGPAQDPLSLSLREYTEEHQVFTLHCELPSARVLDAMLVLMGQLTAAPASWAPKEAILAFGADTIAPLLTHTQWRDEPVPALAILDEATLALVQLSPQDERYWVELGPRLHFLSSGLMMMHVLPSQQEAWVARHGAQRLEHPQGILLDCGWSARWPHVSLASLLGASTPSASLLN